MKYAPMRLQLRSAAFALTLAGMYAAASAARAGESRYAGTYTTTRPGADSTQMLTLVLDRNGRAMLTTRFPDLEQRLGPRILPLREAGSWRERGSTAVVSLTSVGLVRNGKISQPRKDNNTITFALQHCRLTAVRYAQINYGEAGLTLDKSGCRG